MSATTPPPEVLAWLDECISHMVANDSRDCTLTINSRQLDPFGPEQTAVLKISLEAIDGISLDLLEQREAAMAAQRPKLSIVRPAHTGVALAVAAAIEQGDASV